jgi:predicted deacylase
VGRLWFMDRPDRPAELLRSPVDGIVVVTKAIPITEQGDCVFVVGTPIDRAALL